MESSIGQKYRCLWRVDIFKYIEDEKWEIYRWKEKINEDGSSVDVSYKTHTHTYVLTYMRIFVCVFSTPKYIDVNSQLKLWQLL